MPQATNSSKRKDSRTPTEIGPLPDSLLFLVGPHRSGTTFLHQALADTGCFDYISYYDVTEFDRLIVNSYNAQVDQILSRLQAELASFGATRDIDDIPIGPLQAEEYGTLLVRSAFQLESRNNSSSGDYDFLDLLCRKKRRLSKENQPLILKDPFDFYCNFMCIARVFPNARFIFIHRHPFRVINSQLTAERRLYERRNAWYAGLDPTYATTFDHMPRELEARRQESQSDAATQKIVARLSKACEYYCDNIGTLATERHLTMRYEDLCASPETEWVRLADFLQVNEFPTHKVPVVRGREINVLPQATAMYAKSSDLFKKYLDMFGYRDWP